MFSLLFRFEPTALLWLAVAFVATVIEISIPHFGSEGQAEARLRVAQAEAQAIQVVAQALGTKESPAQYLIAQKYLESLGSIATNAQKLVFLPYEASSVMASLGGIKELLQAK